jgi:D-alanine--poly(phosphoribitol) ligase subunit 1
VSTGEINEIISKYSGRRPNPEYRVKPEDPYYILYTSGSTGKPKGVQITLSCLETFLKWYLKICDVGNMKDCVFMDQVSYSFDVSVMDMYVSLIRGTTLYAIDKDMIASFKDLFEYFKKSNISVWTSTPSMVEMCLIDESFNRELLPNLKIISLAGEVLTNRCVEKLFDRFGDIRVINGYGPTESTVLVTAVDIDRDMINSESSLPIGYPMDGCRILILDSDGREVPEGEKGEIIIVSDSVSPGYYKNKETTEKVFFKTTVDGTPKRCYRTGDEGYIKNGLVYYIGRKDFQVKLNGFRIELGDIENNLRKIGFIKNAVVLPISRNGKVQHLAAAVTLDRQMDEREFKIGLMIKDELKKFVPDYMVPRKIVIKDSFPVNVNGKVDRKLLMEEMR